MTAVDERINSKKSAAQQAEDIKQAATSTAEETRQNIGSIEALVKQTAKQVKTIADLKNLESELQVSRKKVRLIVFSLSLILCCNQQKICNSMWFWCFSNQT